MRRLKQAFLFLCVVFTLSVLVVQFTPLARWYALALAGNWTEADGDILIVLSSEEQPDDLLGPVSYGRAIYAVRVWRTGHFRAIVISGGHTTGGHLSLAAVIGNFIQAYGVPRDKIFLEERSTSTRENALFTREMIGEWPGKKVLLTSDAHMFRALRTFQMAGLQVVPRPFPDALKRLNDPLYRLPEVFGLIAETAKSVRYWQKGWIKLSAE
jgi:uncharacterized SAM-binding protein YcdF (DUF218 family)